MSWTTFAIELVNFAVLLAILERVLFRPLRQGIAARRAAFAAREAELARRLTQVEERQAELEREQAALGRARVEALREAEAAGAAERARLLEQAREDASAERARILSLLGEEQEAALVRARELAIERAADVAGRLAVTLLPEELDRRLGERLVDEVERLEPGELGPIGQGLGVELRCARPPQAALLQRLGAALNRALGGPVELSTREESGLLAGAVLRVGGRVLDASLRGEVEALRQRARELIAGGEVQRG